MEYLIGAGVLTLCVGWVYVGWRLSRGGRPIPDLEPTIELLYSGADYLDAECDEEGDSLRKRMRVEAQRLEAFIRKEGE